MMKMKSGKSIIQSSRNPLCQRQVLLTINSMKAGNTKILLTVLAQMSGHGKYLINTW